jgi:hypothetical protein
LPGSTGTRPCSCSIRARDKPLRRCGERLLAEAAGNPLALQELPAGLSDAQLDGGAPLPDALPVTDRLKSAFSQRIERLPEPARAALLIAAAEEAGELAVTLRAAAELGLPPDALDPAEEAGLVHTDGTALSFRHPLIRSVVYESVPLGQRRRTHAALAVALAGEQQAERAIWHRAMRLRPRTRRSRMRSRRPGSGRSCAAVTPRRRLRSSVPRRSARPPRRAPGVSRRRSKPPGSRRKWTEPGSS